MKKELLKELEGGLAVSCQADASSPLANPIHIAALAESVTLGGALAVRIEGTDNICCVRKAVAVPIIGLIKRQIISSEIYITPETSDVQAVAHAGADIIAFDATARQRPCTVQDIIHAIHSSGKLAMADVSTTQEGSAAFEAGADIISTTLAGYTEHSQRTQGPDFELMQELTKLKVPFAAEGRIWTFEDAQRCFALGSCFIVVGSAITRPDAITRRFVQQISNRKQAFIPARRTT